MKKRIITVIILFITLLSYAQVDVNSESGKEKLKEITSVLESPTISMDVDTSVYTINIENTYFTSDQKSAIIGMVAPSSYETMKEELNNQKSNEEAKILNRGELIENGKTILFLKTKLTRGDESYIMYVFCKENGKDSSIMLNTYFEEDKETMYIDIAKKAAFSARVK